MQFSSFRTVFETFGSVCKNCHFTAVQNSLASIFQVSFSSFMWALKKLLKSPMIYKLQSNNNDLMSEKKEGLKIFAWGAEFWKSLFWTVHRPCPCSLWCGMSWNSHHHTWLYHHQGCSITTTRVWNDTSKIDICHPQMGRVFIFFSTTCLLNQIFIDCVRN